VVPTLLAELKRRRVFRALVGYGIAAFAVLQIIEPVMHGLHWPDEVLSYVVVALGLGFPVVAGLAWIYDLKAGRVERTAPAQDGPILRKRIVAIVLVALGLLAAAPGLMIYFFLLGGRQRPTLSAPSIAVLPFVNMSGNKENEYFSDGITDEVIGALANVEGLRVAARTSSFAFKGKNISVRKIAEELAVAHVLEGSIQRNGDELRVVAQLIDALSGYHVWSKTYDRKFRDVFQLEDELARSIVEALRPKLILAASVALAPVYTGSTEAHDLYLQGRFSWNKRSPTALQNAVGLFQRAIDLDANFALAHVGLCDSLILLPAYGWISVPEVLPRSSAAAMKALQLSPSLAEAHSCLCLVRTRTFEWDGAEQECRRAIEQRPAYATAHQWYAIMLHSVGRVPEALAEARRAQQLDPLSAIISSFVAVELYLGRSYDGALAQARKTIELDPAFSLGHSYLALTYLQLNRGRDALGELEPLAGQGNRYDGERGYAYAKVGRRDDALRLLRQMEERSRKHYVAPSARALVYIGLGDKNRALDWLEKAYAELDWRLLYLKTDPLFDELRGEQRFTEILKRMHVQ
jgi:TolB-like protein/Flp pilus assembly protein TadD